MSAAIAEAFEQFLSSKRAAIRSTDPVAALIEGWDNYVGFAEARPRLYAAMMARFLSGADLPAAREGQAMLRQRIAQIEAAGRLAIAPEAAVQVDLGLGRIPPRCCSSSTTLQPGVDMGSTRSRHPSPGLRDGAVQAICTSGSTGVDA